MRLLRKWGALYFTLALVALVTGLPVYAAQQWTSPGGAATQTFYPSAWDACQAYYTAANDKAATSTTRISDTQYWCTVTNPNTGGKTNVSSTGLNSGSCDPGTVFNPAKGMCEAPPCQAGAAAGSVTVLTAWATGPAAGAAIAKKIVPDGGLSGVRYCASSCVVGPVGSPTSCSQSTVAASSGYYKITCDVPMQRTGSTCASSPSVPPVSSANLDSTAPTAPTPELNRCPIGTVNLGTDSGGTPICQGQSSVPSTTPTPSTETKAPPVTNPDGSTTETATTSKTNADGSTTTTTRTTVTGTDGSKTTSESSATSNTPGGGGGRADRPEELGDVCKQHPDLTICKNSQISGNCRDVSCTGDAITCAIARFTAEQNCRGKEADEAIKSSSVFALGTQILAGADPGAKPTSQVVNVQTSLDQSGWMGGGACFPNKVVNIGQFTFSIPFETACPYLIPFRAFLMLLTAYICLQIVSKAVFKG
jgi:hypothetical protein